MLLNKETETETFTSLLAYRNNPIFLPLAMGK